MIVKRFGPPADQLAPKEGQPKPKAAFVTLPNGKVKKLAPNKPCPCGSRKKYKMCCGAGY